MSPRQKSSLSSMRSGITVLRPVPVSRAAMPNTFSSSFHYHIRWLPSDLLDWEPYSSARAADRRARQLVGEDETYTIEKFSSSCQRCLSREYSEPTKTYRQTQFLN
jgi:hypothetical protein